MTSLLAETPQEEPERRGIRSMGLAAWPDVGSLAKMAELIDSEKTQVFVDRAFPLDEINAAMAYRMQTMIAAKGVLTML